jgi:hypothetical protein
LFCALLTNAWTAAREARHTIRQIRRVILAALMFKNVDEARVSLQDGAMFNRSKVAQCCAIYVYY